MLRLFAICLVSVFSSCQKDGGWMQPVPPDPIKLAIADSIQTFKLTPSASTEADRMQFRANHNDMQATGFYVAPNKHNYNNLKFKFRHSCTTSCYRYAVSG
ncbi:hypothetical protein [Sphingobacterium thalpophilum]|uniref:hypothetical protein n=1 Tax=Sphingobacterium thalpophilum TaxID=259 RepID=UPI003C77EA52